MTRKEWFEFLPDEIQEDAKRLIANETQECNSLAEALYYGITSTNTTEKEDLFFSGVFQKIEIEEKALWLTGRSDYLSKLEAHYLQAMQNYVDNESGDE